MSNDQIKCFKVSYLLFFLLLLLLYFETNAQNQKGILPAD